MDNSYIKTEWTLLSFCGALIGIYFASHYFPSAIPGQIKTGYFDVDVASPLLFALGTGIFFGMAQWAALRHILGNANVHAKEAQELWAPVTTIGVVAMMLPLLWIDAVAPARLYIAGLPVMVPGIILLSMLQLALVRKMLPKRSWFWRTATGAALGAALGLPVSWLLLHTCYVPGEISYAGTIGLCIGAFQSGYIGVLSSSLKGASSTQPAE